MKKPPFTYNQWVERVFVGRPISFNWMWNHGIQLRKAEWLVTYPTRLFKEPQSLIGKYSYSQLRKGLWSLHDKWELRDAIWGRGIRWKLRKACIQSMVPLFEKFFSRKPLGLTCHMWWDLLRYFGNDPDERVVNEMFLALEQIILMDSLQCQLAALHGLGHLAHPHKRATINHYLRTHPNLDAEIRNYAIAAIKGKVL